MLVDDEKLFVVAILQFLQKKIGSGLLNADQAESVEVAMQCLQSAFDLQDHQLSAQVGVDLYDLFQRELHSPEERAPPTEEERSRAECLKVEGNNLMKTGQYQAAIETYSEAIKLYRNPIYFCNRAAAYSKLEQHQKAIEDCKTAIALDANYSKAYGRIGLAYSGLGRYKEACDAYNRALELDPANESFRNNLEIARERLKEAAASDTQQQQEQSVPSGTGSFPNPLAGINIASLLNNPALVNMIAQVMSNPEMQNTINSLLTNPGQASGANLNSLLDAGQRLASQLQQQNPEFIETFRRQFERHSQQNNNTDSEGKPDQSNQQPPP